MVDNFQVAESDHYMLKFVSQGALGRFLHYRAVTQVDPADPPHYGQLVIRMNRDTLYSCLVLNLSSPAVVTFPETGGRFVSLELLSEAHDVFPSVYEPGEYLVTQDGCGCRPPCRRDAGGRMCTSFGTPYAFLLVRMLANGEDSADLARAHGVQDGFVVSQPIGADAVALQVAKAAFSAWNQTDLKRIRALLLELKSTSEAPVTFGFWSGLERIDHLFGLLNVAAGWGGVRPQDQFYVFFKPPAEGSYTVTIPWVPVKGNGFWSITVYSADGYMFASPSHYNSEAQRAGKRTIVHFGACDARPKGEFCLPTQPGWNALFRVFRPAVSLLNGSWTLPMPVAD